MEQFTIAEYNGTYENGLWTKEALSANPLVPAKYFGKHWARLSCDRMLLPLTEGVEFCIVPTNDELGMLAKKIMEGIDRNVVRGFHPWQFTGSAILDDNTLLTATTRQDSKLDVEVCFFTDKRPRFREGIDELTIRRVCRYNEQALAERLARLFILMAAAPKQ